MKFIDSNVLIRLITNDVPEQAQQAMKMIQDNPAEDIVMLNSVITEVCFVLEYRSYQLPRDLIYDGLCAILDSNNIIAEQNAQEALNIYIKNPKLDYVDCLLLASATHKKSNLLTFDKDLLKAATS